MGSFSYPSRASACRRRLSSDRPGSKTLDCCILLTDAHLCSCSHLPRNRQDSCTCSYRLCLYTGRSRGTHCHLHIHQHLEHKTRASSSFQSPVFHCCYLFFLNVIVTVKLLMLKIVRTDRTKTRFYKYTHRKAMAAHNRSPVQIFPSPA